MCSTTYVLVAACHFWARSTALRYAIWWHRSGFASLYRRAIERLFSPRDLTDFFLPCTSNLSFFSRLACIRSTRLYTSRGITITPIHARGTELAQDPVLSAKNCVLAAGPGRPSLPYAAVSRSTRSISGRHYWRIVKRRPCRRHHFSPQLSDS
jgi:hypothetical protein